MGVLPQAWEIIFEMQRKMSNEKNSKKKTKAFQLTKRICFFVFFFLLFEPLLLLKLLTFSFLVHLKRFKVLEECNLQFYKSSLNFNSDKARYKFFLGD